MQNKKSWGSSNKIDPRGKSLKNTLDNIVIEAEPHVSEPHVSKSHKLHNPKKRWGSEIQSYKPELRIMTSFPELLTLDFLHFLFS